MITHQTTPFATGFGGRPIDVNSCERAFNSAVDTQQRVQTHTDELQLEQQRSNCQQNTREPDGFKLCCRNLRWNDNRRNRERKLTVSLFKRALHVRISSKCSKL